MTDYKTVFTSLLAMDSYHRNLNQGVFHKRAEQKGDGQSSKDAVGFGTAGEVPTMFGDATVYMVAIDAATSFHAIAYKLSDGSIIR